MANQKIIKDKLKKVGSKMIHIHVLNFFLTNAEIKEKGGIGNNTKRMRSRDAHQYKACYRVTIDEILISNV